MGEIRLMIETSAGRKFARLAEELDEYVVREVEGFMDDAELAFQAVVPKRSTRMARAIHSVRTGPGVFEVLSEATSPDRSYHYTGVTRFGHRKAWITPTRRGPATRVISTRRPRGRGKRAALRIPIGGGLVIFRSRVRGVKVDHDWVQDAMPDIQLESRELLTRIGHRLTLRFG